MFFQILAKFFVGVVCMSIINNIEKIKRRNFMPRINKIASIPSHTKARRAKPPTSSSTLEALGRASERAYTMWLFFPTAENGRIYDNALRRVQQARHGL